jgi:hypothetical protein
MRGESLVNSDQPVATSLDVRKQLGVLDRQLVRMTKIEALRDRVPPGGWAALRWPRGTGTRASWWPARAFLSCLTRTPSAEPVHLGVPVKFPDGWEAHQSFMAHLAKFRVPK